MEVGWHQRDQGHAEGLVCSPEMYWTPSRRRSLTPWMGAGAQGPQGKVGVSQPLGDPAERLPPGKSDKRDTSPPPPSPPAARPGVPRVTGPVLLAAGLASREKEGLGAARAAGRGPEPPKGSIHECGGGGQASAVTDVDPLRKERGRRVGVLELCTAWL